MSHKQRRSRFLIFSTPFGFAGSPGIFWRILGAIQHYHRPPPPRSPFRNAITALSDEVFSGDGMLLEADIGQRPIIPNAVWETGGSLFLG